MSFTSRLINIMFTRGDNKRDAGLTSPEDIRRFDDIRYGQDEKVHVLDVYKPRDKEKEVLPVIVSVHGGGWVYGDKERYQYYCMSLAQRGFAVVNFTYRLAPANKFPAQMEDLNDVVKWVLANHQQYGFDCQNVFFVGDSAGAHLTALYSCVCTNEQYAKRYQWQAPVGFVPTGVALNCGIYEVDRNKKSDRMMLKLMKDLLGKADEERCELVSPLRHIGGNFPPAYLMTCKGDFLQEQAERMARKLKEKNIDFTYKIYGTEEKPLYHVFHCNMREPEAVVCNDEECNFFNRMSGR